MSESSGKKLAELAPKIMGAFHDLGKQHPQGERMSMRQYQALIVLHAGGKLTLSQFCKKLALAPSTGTELANRLIDLGFFSKEGEEGDRRQAFLSVTPRGYELMQCRQDALAGMFARFLEPYSQEDRDLFIHSFETIWNLIERYSADKV